MIAQIDRLVGEQLDALLHHPRLLKLQGRWTGLAWLVAGLPPGARIRVRLLDLSWPELARDLARAPEFDQSQLFRKIYEEEFGTPGGEPYGLLVVDHAVRHRPTPDAPTDDVAALASLAGVAAAAFVPTVVAAAPELLGLDSFADLGVASDLADPFRGAEFARWRSLAGREDMRFIAVALPSLLVRRPWRDDPARTDGFRYAEHAADAGARAWMNAGFAFAEVVARAFANHAWPADVRGSETDREGGGLVTGLCAERFAGDPAWHGAMLEVAFSDAQERALGEAGLMPLALLPFGEEAVFGAVPSLQSPARYAGPEAAAAQANARISAQINAMLCVSRFAHHIKLRGRAMTGSFRTAEEIEQELHGWLQTYVNASPTGSSEMRARFPLMAAKVTVREKRGQPGSFACTAQLQPHFQLDDVSAAFRLVTVLAGRASP
jgi:type VI secretion system protein ImpD/type VI secretion system protein ImpC